MIQIITPDLNATYEIDIFEEKINFEISVLDLAIQKKENKDVKSELEKLKFNLLGELENIDKNTSPKIIIGFIPIAKRNELQYKYSELLRDMGDKPTVEQLQKRDKIYREAVILGVKGHKNILGCDFDSIENVVSIYEYNDLLAILYKCIMEYNTLSDRKKKK